MTLLLTAVTGAWADDAVSATQTFTNGRATCTWNPISATVAAGNTAGGDGLYFTAGSSKSISTSSGTVAGGTDAIHVLYVQVVSASSHGTITITSPSDAADRKLLLETYDADTNADAYVSCSKSGSTATFTASDVVSYAGGYYVKLTNNNSDFKIKTIEVTLTGETYPEAVAINPVFSLTSSTISTSGTSQIRVGSKAGLDGITLSNISYTTSGIVTVDAETGVVTPVAAGTTTISFDSEAVAAKYNASIGNAVTITVITSITVYDATGFNKEFILTQDNITAATNDFVSTSTQDWAERKPSGYSETNYYNLNGTSRYITFKVSGASSFQIVIQNGSGSNRKYTVKIDEADGEDIIATKNTTSTSKVFATGTKDEVTIKIIGTIDGSLYPAAIIFNPATTISRTKGTTSFSSSQALNFAGSDLTAYAVSALSASSVTLTAVPDVPASTGLILIGETGDKDVLLGTATTLATTNKLHASVDATDVAANSTYVVSGGKICLFTGTEIPAGKAYLLKTDVDAVGGGSATPSPELNIVFGDENSDMTTGISNVEAQKGFLDGEFYNLNGQRVSQPAKGLYIVNGRKVVIK